MAKLRDMNPYAFRASAGMAYGAMDSAMASAPPPVTQQAFDDFHLYDLNRTVTLRSGETKQVQFLEGRRGPYGSGVRIRRWLDEPRECVRGVS